MMQSPSALLRMLIAFMGLLSGLASSGHAHQGSTAAGWDISHVMLAPAGDAAPGRSVLWIGITNNSPSNRVICVNDVSMVVDEPGHGYSQDAGPHGCRGLTAFVPVMMGGTYFLAIDRDSSVFAVSSSALEVEITLQHTDITAGPPGVTTTLEWTGTVGAARAQVRVF